MTDARQPSGLFGKVPQQADFVSLHLPATFTESWHAWLQATLSVSREQLGDDWLALYLTGPIWRFALSAGVCGEAAVAGVLIPSVDEIGRYFPLTVAHLGRHRPWSAYLSGGDWYDAAERVALLALDEATGYSRLVEAVEALAPPQFRALPRLRAQPSVVGRDSAWVVSLPPGLPAFDLLPGLLEQTYGRLLGRCSLWWTEGSERVEPCLLVSAGLPEVGQVAAMLDGDWQRWKWATEQIVPAAEPEPAPA